MSPQRPTDDADAVVNARSPRVLGAVTGSLVRLGFTASAASADGIQHRWTRGEAVIDVLIPDGMGERAASRPGVTGSPTVAAPGGTQALARTQIVELRVGSRVGSVPRPDLMGALIVKAKARLDTLGPGRDRHCDDFAVLVSMLAARDVRGLRLTAGERRSLRRMIEVTLGNDRAMGIVPNVESRLRRLAQVVA